MQSKFKQLQRLNQTKCCNETHGKCVLNPPQSGGKICYYSRDIDFFLRIVFIGAARTSIDDVIKTVNSHKINRSMLHERLGISYTVYFIQLNNRPINVCSRCVFRSLSVSTEFTGTNDETFPSVQMTLLHLIIFNSPINGRQ